MIEVINRERCVYSGKKDLEHLFTLENFPLFMKCEDGYSSKEDDVFIDMEWYISKSTGAIQLKKGHDNLSMFKNLLKYRHESKKQVCNSFTYFRGQI